MHFCIQFSYRFWSGFCINFLSQIQMFHNAETLRKLFLPQFLKCFVNVALFRTCTEIIDNVLWNAKKQASKFDGKSIKNQSKNVFFESSESDRVSDPILGAFWHHFGTILGGLRVHLPPFRPPEAPPGGLLGHLGASWGASAPPNLNFDRVWTSLERSWSHFGPILEAQDPMLDVQTSILEPQVPPSSL